MLEVIWVKEIIGTEQSLETRRRALLVLFHVRCRLSWTPSHLDQTGQMIKALSLLRLPLAYTAVGRIIDVLKLASFDPVFVDEAAKGFSVLAQGKGKGKEKGSHLTSKVSLSQEGGRLSCSAVVCAKAVELRPTRAHRGG